MSTMRRAATGLVVAVWAIALLVGCQPAPPVVTSPIAPPPPAAAPRCPSAPDLTIVERQRLLAVSDALPVTPHWSFWQATLWPGADSVVALRASGRAEFSYIVPGSGVVVSSHGDAVVLGAPAHLVIAGAAPQALPWPLHAAHFSPDGARFVGLDGETIKLVETATRQLIASMPIQPSDELSWRGELVVVSSARGHAIYDGANLTLWIAETPGQFSPSGRLFLSFGPVGTPSDVRVLEVASGKVLRRTPLSGWTPMVYLTPDDSRLVMATEDGIRIVKIKTGQIWQAPWLDLGEADAESRRWAAPTADGHYLCQMMDHDDATYDLLARRQLRGRRDLAVRCVNRDNVAYVVKVPLKPHEQLLEIIGEGFGNHGDFVLNVDGSLAAMLAVDSRVAANQARELTMLIVELASQRVVHRVSLGVIAEGGWMPTLQAGQHGAEVSVLMLRNGETAQNRLIVDWASGNVQTVPEPEEVEPAAVEPFSDVASAARTTVRGSTVLIEGPQWVEAWRLGQPRQRLRFASGPCRIRLSPLGGAAVRSCPDDQGEVLFLDGRKARPYTGLSHEHGFAVAEDGSLAAAGYGPVERLLDGKPSRVDLNLGGGAFTYAFWSPDSRSLALWHAARRAVYLVDRDGGRPRWSKAVTRWYQLRFTDDSKQLALLGTHGEIEDVWNVADGGSANDKMRGSEVDAQRDGRLHMNNWLPFGRLASADFTFRPLLARRMPTSGALWHDQLLLTAEGGAIRLHALATGATIATLLPFRRGGAIALFEDGRIDWLGEPFQPPELVCMRQNEVVAPEACQPLSANGALEAVFQDPVATSSLRCSPAETAQ